MRRRIVQLSATGAALAIVTLAMRAVPHASSATVSLAYLLVVLFVAAYTDLWTAIITSVAATLCFNFFFIPPVDTFTIADPQNWAALVSFLSVSVVASNLSALARARSTEAMARRVEVGRLFDLTRDILQTTEEDALGAVAGHVASRFRLKVCAICLAEPAGGWRVHQGGNIVAKVSELELAEAYSRAVRAPGFAAQARVDATETGIAAGASTPLRMTPVRLGPQPIGLLVTDGDELEPATRDALGGIVAIAIERNQFLEERRNAELARQRAELSSALLASLSHDLRTPLTAIRTAVANLDAPWLGPDQRRSQAAVAIEQVDRLQRLFDEILDMARIQARAVSAERSWVTPAEVIEAAVAYAGPSLAAHRLQIDAQSEFAAKADPRLTSSALAHLLENAAAYSPVGSVIHIRGWTDEQGLRFTVRDHGAGLAPNEINHLFEPFYRGVAGRRTGSGSGMGLAISRGLLAVEDGRVTAENASSHGAQFSIVIPGQVRPVFVHNA